MWPRQRSMLRARNEAIDGVPLADGEAASLAEARVHELELEVARLRSLGDTRMTPTMPAAAKAHSGSLFANQAVAWAMQIGSLQRMAGSPPSRMNSGEPRLHAGTPQARAPLADQMLAEYEKGAIEDLPLLPDMTALPADPPDATATEFLVDATDLSSEGEHGVVAGRRRGQRVRKQPRRSKGMCSQGVVHSSDARSSSSSRSSASECLVRIGASCRPGRRILDASLCGEKDAVGKHASCDC